MDIPVSSRGRSKRLAPELHKALFGCRGILISASLFSGMINVLALSTSLYMLQVYDRVIPSHSVPTLVGLSIGMLILYSAYGLFDIVRVRLLSRAAVRFELELRSRVMGLVLQLPLRSASVDAMGPVRDFDHIRSFMSSGAPMALFDMPWMPFYLALVWLLHPALGLLATLGGLTLVGLTVLTELRGRGPTRDMTVSGATRIQSAETYRRNAVAIRSMGMTDRIVARWNNASDTFIADQIAVTDLTGKYGSISRILRLVLQSAVLGLGAYLVIQDQASGGVMIAASILVSRALAPIEVAIANWRSFISARQSLERISELLQAFPAHGAPLSLPPPTRRLEIAELFVTPPGQASLVVSGATFALDAGAGLGIIGTSGSGKSTLLRAVIGAWPAVRGTVRLDGATLDQWSSDELGRHVGYLPQELEMIDGSVAENISRFEPNAPANAIIEAAREAGVHDLIVRLPNGYDTRVGEGGLNLSAGQRQRIALARALYRKPFLVALDEPNSNLDREGDIALERAIRRVRQRGGIVIIVAHRPSALVAVDHLLVMKPGQKPQFGLKDDLYRTLGLSRGAAQTVAGRPQHASANQEAAPVRIVPTPIARASTS